MATEVEKEVNCSLVNAGTLTLEYSAIRPLYTGIVVSMNMIMVIDWNPRKVRVHRLQDGKLVATTKRLESVPSSICLLNDAEVGVIMWNGLIHILPIESTSGILTPNRTLRVNGGLDQYHGIVKYNDNLLACGRIQDMMYWCIVSLNDGHVDSIHQICKGNWWTYLTTKSNMIYISCNGGRGSPNTGVYEYNILKPSQCLYTYKHQELMWPTVITIDRHGFIFVCNHLYPFDCVHLLTDKCQPVSIFTQGIPPRLDALFWDQQNGHLYVTSDLSTTITRYRPEYSGSVIPLEILRMDDKSIQLYKAALRDGKEKIYNLRVMVVGQFGVGKTTLIKRLLGKPVNISERKSTEGIDVYKHCCKISLETGEWIVQHEDSDELSRLQRLMKLLSGPDPNSDVSQEQGGHREVIYEREATPEEDNSHMSEAASSSKLDQEDHMTYSQPVKLSSVMDARHCMTQLDQKSSTDTKSEAEVIKKKRDAVIEILHLINKNADKLDDDLVKYAALSIWDFAGQYAFYTTHQTFLSSHALYLLVIDLNQQITDLIEDDKCFLDMTGIKLCKVHELVEIWLNAIHTCVPLSKSSIPHVILVGTHVDKLSEKSRKEVIDKYFKELRYLLKDKPTICHLMDDIGIDNTQRDPMLEILKKKIFELASEQPHWGEEKPARWLPLEQAIMTLKASGAKVVARSLIEEINVSGSVRIEDRDELELFLRFHHEMGTILYFSVEGLREKIVLDPQWLIDALKSLITAEKFIRKYPAITSKWYEFEEQGKLTHELIDAIWTEKKHKEFHDNKDHILLLMEELNIIARPLSFIEDGKEVKEDNYFLAPCMLRQETPQDVICPKPNPQMESSSVLCYIFTEKFLPSPIFHRLLAACVARWPLATKKKEEMQENQIFCGCCVFQLDECHKLILHFREYVIFVRVTRMGIKKKTPSSELCIGAREFITATLSKIIGCLSQNLKYEQHIQCPEYNGVSVNSLLPVSLLREHDEVRCDFHDNMIESYNLLKFWFKDQVPTDEDNVYHFITSR
ncbi:hypothetical protein CHS0354_010723 [Potamilus streckersoni]|uniref:non-specific serine/threonine protein kinase n=1 Tax=Potamilus streckersoni TaxID=2493646 RepID=A0AAE0W2Z0_9BIVA|nr:hypothetical protein CHS0354_010723 [Potamilus streckersoni]